MAPLDGPAADDPEATHISDAPASRLRIGGYLIERPIASGANGIVYRALDERLGRIVALKVLKEDAFPQARERFLREVRVIAGLQHPNVVLLYGAGEDNGIAWAAMEMLPASLAQELRVTPRFSADAIRAIARDVCRGLDAAWKTGVIHRDIKPSNLLRSSSGAIKVADFGLAKDLSIELNLTAADVVLGTPWYVSPEQASGKAVGVVSDLYSLGATLYHLAAGRVPFESSNALDVIVRHAIEAVPPLPPDVPDRLARLIYRLLEKDPSKRPADYATVLAALDDDSIDVGVEPALPSPVDRVAVDAMSASALAAARAALQMGRAKRVITLAGPMLSARGSAWVQAGFLVAAAHEETGSLADARAVLESIAEAAAANEDRALALWNLGRLCEKESAAALDRAIATYARIGELSTSRFPKTLLEARVARLRRRGDERTSNMESGS